MFAVNLNEDNEFGDPDIVLLETVGAAQAPDWHADEEMVAAIEQQFISIQYLYEDMVKEGGMNKQFAMEAHRLLPEMAEKYPLGYFTSQTTATLYKPALEELHAGIWALIGAAGLAIAAMIWKFVRWIIKKWNGESGSDISIGSDEGKPSDAEINKGIEEATKAAEQKVVKQEQVGEELKVAEAANKEAVKKVEESGVVKQIAEAAAKENKGDNAHVQSFEDAAFMLTDRHMGGKYDHLVNQTDNAWYDILHEGRWTKLMLSIGPVLSATEAQLMQRVQTFESIFSVTQTQGDPVRHKNAMDLIEEAKKPLTMAGTNYHSLEQLARSLDRPEGLMAFNAGKEKLKPVVASESIERLINSSSYKSLLRSRVKFIQKLTMFNKAQIKLSEISNKWNAQHPGQGVGVGVPKDISHAMAPVLSQLKRDLLFMMQINTAVEHFLDKVDSLNMTLTEWWSNTWTAIEHYAMKNHEQGKTETKVEMPLEVQKAKGIMTLLRRAMGKVPASDLGGGLAKSAKDLMAKAVSAGASKPAGQVEHPKGAVAPGMGNRQIPTKEWQKQ